MSEHIVHSAVLEDSFSLISHLENIDSSLLDVMQTYHQFARLGCVTVAGDSFSYRLLEQFKSGPEDRYTPAKLAFVVGWISHRACDRVMKPIWKEAPFKGRGTDVDPRISPFECSIYHEAKAYGIYFADQSGYRMAVFPDALQEQSGASEIRQDAAYGLVQASFATNLMNIQTIPDGMNDQERFENICMRTQKFYVDLQRYRNAIVSPTPEKTKEFLTDINWYDENEAILRVAARLRAGEAVSAAEIRAAIAAPTESKYACAVILSVQYILSALHYLTHPEADMAWLKEKLDIGKLGPGGLAV